jgi:rare lipoprotein A (peptidoglycan hydrolase)
VKLAVRAFLVIALLAAAFVIVTEAADGHEGGHHSPGCNTLKCDRRVAPKMNHAPASWYGPGFYGNTTACGQTYSAAIVGVANKSMRCGTRLRICYRGCVTARVIDRGPYAGNRVFDLSYATKRAIGFGDLGTVRWRVVR